MKNKLIPATELSRDLTLFHLVMMGLGMMIGAGGAYNFARIGIGGGGCSCIRLQPWRFNREKSAPSRIVNQKIHIVIYEPIKLCEGFL